MGQHAPPHLYPVIADLGHQIWQALWLVADATFVGAGLAGFLQQAMLSKVVPFVFSAQSKLQLGWDFLGLVVSANFRSLSTCYRQDQAKRDAKV